MLPHTNISNRDPRSEFGRPVVFDALLTIGGAFLLTLLAGGCGQNNDIQVYRVAKEVTPTAEGATTSPSQAAGSSFQWELPKGWKEMPPGEMRVASFSVAGKDGKTADVSVVPLPGLSMRDLDNVNRWRGQVGLAAIPESELAPQAEPVQVAGQTAQLFDLAGEIAGEKSRILGAILHREEIAWFFKMTGDDKLVAQQKSAFKEFLRSFGFPPAVGGQSELPASHPPISNRPQPAPALSASASSEGKPGWQVPAKWQEVPGGQFLAAKFMISGADKAKAAVNVSTSAGNGGGLTPNVNRWRRQLGLEELPEEQVTKLATPIDIPGQKAMLVDMTGTDPATSQKVRLVGVMVPLAKATWFYKLMGDPQVVEAENATFKKFIQTAKHPDAP